MRILYYLTVMVVGMVVWCFMPRETWPMLISLSAGAAMVVDIVFLPEDRPRS